MFGFRCLTPLFCLASFVSAPQAIFASDDDLSREIQSRQVEAPVLGSHTAAAVIPALEALAPFRTESCVESRQEAVTPRVAITFNSEGKACRIYDLSFPTLTGAVSALKVGSLPLQPFKSDDYLSWLRGDTATVEQKMADFQSSFGPEALDNSWYGKLSFKDGQKGLRRSFNLAELDLGGPVEFSREDRIGLQRMLALAGSSSQDLSSPEKLFSKINLQWNELDKVFEILVDFDFLPIRGPLALVDYNIQYKYVVEKLVRSAVLNTLNYAAGFIPDPTARRVVQVALADTFEFVELAYEYQMNRLENTLEKAIPSARDAALIEKGVNILAAQRSPLLVQYALSRILHTRFDLNALDKVGRDLRYAAAKQREALRAQLHSDLVVKKQCEMSLVEDNFGICTKSDGKRKLYSLLSSQKIFVFDMGAPMIHNYSMPVQTLLQRNGSWALASAVRMFPLPIPGFLQTQLVTLVKGFATAGLLDEAYLLNPLQESGQTDEFTSYHTAWLFRQNLIPFLAKSPAFEARVISAGSEALARRLGQ